jgi:hypothetical protein
LPATDLTASDIAAVQAKIRRRGLRWLHRHGHLDDLAVHALDAPDHAGGWSVDAQVEIPDWDRHGLERLVRYCARPPLAQERLRRLNDELLVYRLRKPTLDGRTELILTPLELLDRLVHLVTPPRVHKHRDCGVLAPNTKLRQAVNASADPGAAAGGDGVRAGGSVGRPDALAGDRPDRCPRQLGLNSMDSTERPSHECRRDRSRERRRRSGLLAPEAESRLAAQNRASQGCWRPVRRPPAWSGMIAVVESPETRCELGRWDAGLPRLNTWVRIGQPGIGPAVDALQNPFSIHTRLC